MAVNDPLFSMIGLEHRYSAPSACQSIGKSDNTAIAPGATTPVIISKNSKVGIKLFEKP
jgi:hypothetical protein